MQMCVSDSNSSEPAHTSLCRVGCCRVQADCLGDLRIAKRDLEEVVADQQGQVLELEEQLIVLHQELLAAKQAALAGCAPEPGPQMQQQQQQQPPKEEGLVEGLVLPQLSVVLAATGPGGSGGGAAEPSLQPDTPVVVAGQQSNELLPSEVEEAGSSGSD